MELLKAMCAIQAPSGNEAALKDYILDYVNKNKSNWKSQPRVIIGDELQDSIILIFGKPRTAIYAHMDNIGFTVRYNKGLVKIGGPRLIDGTRLVGKDSQGIIDHAILRVDEDHEITYEFEREIERGTELSYKPDWREDTDYIQCCYMDNRLGVYNALKQCETLQDGAIAFSCWEEHGKGSVSVIGRYLYKNYNIRQALISDISWVTEGVPAGKGTVVSIRDSGIPRRSYVNRIIEIAKNSGVPFQLEVEGSGGSDGIELQHSPYPIDWCFVGAPEDNVHTPDEKVHRKDIDSMLRLYEVLMKEL